MTNQRSTRIRQIYGILLSVSIAAAAVCLMVACVSIYRQGDHPFSQEVVAAAFNPIAVPVYLCLGLVVVGFVLDFFLPAGTGKLSAGKQTELVLKRLHSKTDLNACAESLRSAVLAQQKTRAMHKKIRAVILILAAVLFLCYALNPGNFHQSRINASMIHAMQVLLPCLAVSFGCAVFTAYHNHASMEKEIALLKQAGAEARKASAPKAAPQSDKRLAAARAVFLLVGIAILAYGFIAGGTADVLTKAVNICTECVGLG